MTPHKKRIMLYVLGIIILGFILLTILVSFFPHSLIDREFSEEVQEHQNPFLDSAMKGISWFGYVPISVVMVIVVSLIFFLLKYTREAIYILLTLISGLISWILKILVNRPRPTEDLVRIVEKANHQSFPSGHTLFYTIFFGFMVLLMYRLEEWPKWVRITIGAFCLLLIFLIPFSRIYLGAHWFTDVLGGFLLGILYLFILSYYYLEKSRFVK